MQLIPGQRRFPWAHCNKTYGNSHTNVKSPDFLHVLGSFSSKQAIMQTTLNSIPEYDRSNKAATILWLDHIEMVAGISKLKGLALGDITVLHKEGNLTWYSFR